MKELNQEEIESIINYIRETYGDDTDILIAIHKRSSAHLHLGTRASCVGCLLGDVNIMMLNHGALTHTNHQENLSEDEIAKRYLDSIPDDEIPKA
jgi:hypothetical protein